MRRLAAILLGFGYMVLLIESLGVAVAWWQGQISDPEPLQWLLLAMLAPLAWIWWRYLSIFRKGCNKVQCGIAEVPLVHPSSSPKTDD